MISIDLGTTADMRYLTVLLDTTLGMGYSTVGSRTTLDTYLACLYVWVPWVNRIYFLIMWDMFHMFIKSVLMTRSSILLLMHMITYITTISFLLAFLFLKLLVDDPINTLWFVYWYSTYFFFVEHKAYPSGYFMALTMRPPLSEFKDELLLSSCHRFFLTFWSIRSNLDYLDLCFLVWSCIILF